MPRGTRAAGSLSALAQGFACKLRRGRTLCQALSSAGPPRRWHLGGDLFQRSELTGPASSVGLMVFPSVASLPDA
jgi:hypothetical protein